MNRVRTSYRITQDVTVYREQDEGYAQIPHTVQAAKTIFAAVADHETRKVGGVLVDVVLFSPMTLSCPRCGATAGQVCEML
jgi:hypothetical protein